MGILIDLMIDTYKEFSKIESVIKLRNIIYVHITVGGQSLEEAFRSVNEASSRKEETVFVVLAMMELSLLPEGRVWKSLGYKGLVTFFPAYLRVLEPYRFSSVGRL